MVAGIAAGEDVIVGVVTYNTSSRNNCR